MAETAETVADGSNTKRVYKLVVEPRPSEFSWKDFLDLNRADRSHNTPLAVIAHIDVNAFFAQAEQLRLGLSSSDPVVCVQWNSLIAVSYAARKFGISRMDSLDSARKKCPNIIAAHTAVFKRGEPNWSYREAGVLPDGASHKVSLDPYRRESRKMMRLFRSKCDKVEKASVDESYMDFGRLIYTEAVSLFEELREVPSDTNENLPPVPTKLPQGCEFVGEVIANDNEDADSNERTISDWDDVFIAIGSKIAGSIRDAIQQELGYTTSCGVSRVKTISKLASGFIKPDNQTIVRSSAIPKFCDNFDFTDFGGLGGKTGAMLRVKLLTPSEGSIRYLRDKYTLEDLDRELSPDTALATTLYKMVRGELYTPLNLRTDVKSMASSKNFTGDSVTSLDDIKEWMPVFCGDILQRLQEFDEEAGILSGDTTHKVIRRAKTFSINFRTKEFQSFTRQCPFPLTASLEKVNDLLYKNGCKLAENAIDTWGEFSNTDLFPLTHFGITISNFEEMDLSRSIDDFAVRGQNNDAVINSMFAELDKQKSETPSPQKKPKTSRTFDILSHLAPNGKRKAPVPNTDPRFCEECDKVITDEDIMSHKDFHLALKLSREGDYEPATRPAAPPANRKKPKKMAKMDKGQSTLPFGKQ